MAKEYRVPVYSSEDEKFESGAIVSRVRYNEDLDYWDGRNHSNGGNGYHKGITKLKDGSYVIIRGSQWQGDRDYGYIVSAEEALQEILKSDNAELLKTKKFKGLNELYKQTMIEEEEEDLIEEEV
ncbi:hypothetical protein [Priestia megaterium]|uniref:hypothetical protein n=1 Tax=Priestia megaterium TaxID=1404 RepID=UPI000BFE4001|nr:hypothetical protein [Priestia megaterium]PGQ88366.1 hypothetical protein COA18_05395 [Priestia megaterium]